MIKKLSAIAIAILLVLSVHTYGFAADGNRPAIQLNGAAIQPAAYIDYGNVYLPLRAVGEALGYQIQWSQKDRTVSVSGNGKNILIDPGNGQITAGDHTYYMGGDYLYSTSGNSPDIQGVTYMGENFFSESLGLKVLWDKEKVVLESKGENAVSIKTVKEASETEHIKITLQYPQLDGLEDKSVQDKINTAFEKAAVDAKNEGLKNVADTDWNAPGYTGSPNKYETYFDYRVKYNQNGLLSLTFDDYQYTGGAHGMTVRTAHTINLQTGEEYKLKDLFNNDAAYVPFISNVVRTEIDERTKEGLLAEIQGTSFSTIRPDQDFFLSDAAVVVYFQQYEYFPYAAGIQEFPVSFSALNSLLKSDLPFLKDASGSAEASDQNRALYDSKVVYTAEDGLYSANMSDGKAALLVKGNGISAPVFSKDGSAVAFMREGDLYAYSFAASKTVLMLKAADSYCPGPNGSFYASSQKSGIVSVNPQTAQAETLVPAEIGTTYLRLSMSPNLKLLAYDSISVGDDNLYDSGGVWIYDTETQKAQLIIKAQKADSTSMGMIPNMGKWSPDSGKLFIWIKSQSASLSADGVSAAIYDVADGKLTDLDKEGLAYDENVSFATPAAFAMITGGSRMMFENKDISIFDLGSGKSAKTIEIPGKVATTPYYSSDGKMLAFSASPAANAGDEYERQIATISKRQIYLYTDGKVSALTSGDTYRSEAPVFLKNDKYIVFARINADGEKSIWIMDSDGKNQKQLAGWKYSDPSDDRAVDYYGRIDWSNMFAIFDNTEVK